MWSPVAVVTVQDALSARSGAGCIRKTDAGVTATCRAITVRCYAMTGAALSDNSGVRAMPGSAARHPAGITAAAGMFRAGHHGPASPQGHVTDGRSGGVQLSSEWPGSDAEGEAFSTVTALQSRCRTGLAEVASRAARAALRHCARGPVPRYSATRLRMRTAHPGAWRNGQSGHARRAPAPMQGGCLSVGAPPQLYCPRAAFSPWRVSAVASCACNRSNSVRAVGRWPELRKA